MAHLFRIVALACATWLVWLCGVSISFAGSPAMSKCPQRMIVDTTSYCFPDYMSKMNFFADYAREHPSILCSDWLCKSDGGTPATSADFEEIDPCWDVPYPLISC